jgi:hypothetical protein
MKFEIIPSISNEISKKYEVINITTDDGMFIANGILTHNKPECGSLGASSRFETQVIHANYGYGAANLPLTASVQVITTTTCAGSYIEMELVSPSRRTGSGGGSILVPMGTPDISGNCISLGTLRLGYYNTDAFQDIVTSATVTVTATDNIGRSSTNSDTFTKSVNSSCLTPKTLIEKYDGSAIYLEDIEIGDELLTIDFKKMNYKKTIVTRKSSTFVDKLFSINDGILQASEYHNHVIKRAEEWMIVKSHNLQIGDILLSKTFQQFKISKIDII